MSDSKHTGKKFDYSEPLELIPVIKRVLTVSIGTLFVFNGMLKVPVLQDGVVALRKAVHGLLDFVGGENYKHNPDVTEHTKDAALDFAIDGLMTITIAGLINLIPGVGNALNKGLHLIESAPDKILDNLKGVAGLNQQRGHA